MDISDSNLEIAYFHLLRGNNVLDSIYSITLQLSIDNSHEQKLEICMSKSEYLSYTWITNINKNSFYFEDLIQDLQIQFKLTLSFKEKVSESYEDKLLEKNSSIKITADNFKNLINISLYSLPIDKNERIENNLEIKFFNFLNYYELEDNFQIKNHLEEDIEYVKYFSNVYEEISYNKLLRDIFNSSYQISNTEIDSFKKFFKINKHSFDAIIKNSKAFKDKNPTNLDYKKRNIVLYLKNTLYYISNYILYFIFPKATELLKLLILADLDVNGINSKPIEDEKTTNKEEIDFIKRLFAEKDFILFNSLFAGLNRKLECKELNDIKFLCEFYKIVNEINFSKLREQTKISGRNRLKEFDRLAEVDLFIREFLRYYSKCQDDHDRQETLKNLKFTFELDCLLEGIIKDLSQIWNINNNEN